MDAKFCVEVTAANFQAEVVERSMQVPVLLDFWAEWCEPCRTLTPVLEQAAEDYAGAFVLGKVNTEVEQDLAQAFKVQSIPFVVLLQEGRVLDVFSGATDQADVKSFLQAHGVVPAAAKPVEVDPDSPQVRLATAKEAALAGDTEAARQALQGIPEEDPLMQQRQNLETGLILLESDLQDASPAGQALAQAKEHVLAGRLAQAMQAILDSAAADRSHADGLARKAMMLCQVLSDPDSEAADSYRRQLATLLY